MAKKPAPIDDENDDADDFTPRQLEVMNNTITAAVTSHLKRGLKPIQDAIGGIDDIKATLAEMVKPGSGAAPVVAPVAGAAPTAGAAAPAGGPTASEIAMKRRVDALEEERRVEREGARAARRDSRLTELATAAGVDKNRLRGAVAILREQTKFDPTTGDPLMPITRKSGGQSFTEDVDLDPGAAEFFKTDEGKSYLAPTQARGGSGSGRGTNATGVVRGQSGGAGGNAPAVGATKQDRKVAAAESLMGAVGELLGGGNINL